jgi:hypothetical protein
MAHAREKVRPGGERQHSQNARAGMVLLECGPEMGPSGRSLQPDVRVSVHMVQQGTFAIAGHAVAKDQVMHATTDIDGIDLHVAEMQESLADRDCRLVEQECPP